MTTDERLMKLLAASPETLKTIDDILEGRMHARAEEASEPPNCRLITVTDACRMLNMKYPTFHRAMQAECFDVVNATGKSLIREESVIAFARGERQPSDAAVEARRSRAASRRERDNRREMPATAAASRLSSPRP